MRDQISLARIKVLHPAAREQFQKFIETVEDTLNITLRIVQGLRTFDEQQTIYDQGRTKPGNIVSNARPGSSFHNYGLAIDIAVLDAGKINWDFDYKRIASFMPKDQFWFWGGNFKSIKDNPHFEISFGFTWRQLQDKYNAKDFISGTQYVNL